MLTSQECNVQKELVKKEMHLAQKGAKDSLLDLETERWRQPGTQHGPRHLSVPRVNVPTETACQRSASQSRRQVRSSQAYGWLPPVDEPRYGHSRSPMFLNNAMDKSHLG